MEIPGSPKLWLTITVVFGVLWLISSMGSSSASQGSSSEIVMHNDPKTTDAFQVVLNWQSYNTNDDSQVGVKGVASNAWVSEMQKSGISVKNVTITAKFFDSYGQYVSKGTYFIPELDTTAPFDIAVPATGIFKDGSKVYSQSVAVTYDGQ